MLGGTFDPPHLAHLALARHALRELSLARVLLMPARLSPHKPTTPGPESADCERAAPEERLEMCRLIARAEPGVDVCDLELRREGPSYTVDTLRALSADDPETPLTFILGADVARTLPAWREPRELLALARLAVAARGETAERDVRAAVARVLGRPAPRAHDEELHVRFLSMPPLEASSSLVRERVRRDEPVDGLVGPDVAGYIDAHGLYRAQPARVAGVSTR